MIQTGLCPKNCVTYRVCTFKKYLKVEMPPTRRSMSR